MVSNRTHDTVALPLGIGLLALVGFFVLGIRNKASHEAALARSKAQEDAAFAARAGVEEFKAYMREATGDPRRFREFLDGSSARRGIPGRENPLRAVRGQTLPGDAVVRISYSATYTAPPSPGPGLGGVTAKVVAVGTAGGAESTLEYTFTAVVGPGS